MISFVVSRIACLPHRHWLVQIHTTTVVIHTLIPRHSSIVVKTSCSGKNHYQQSEYRSYRMALLDKNNTSSVILQHKQRGNRSSEDKETEGRSYQTRSREILVLLSVSEINEYCAIHHFFFSPFIQRHCAKSTRTPSKRHAEKHSDQSNTLSNNLTGFIKHGITVKL